MVVKEKGPAIKHREHGVALKQVRAMERREGQDNLSSMESLVSCCLMSPIVQEMLRASDMSSMTLSHHICCFPGDWKHFYPSCKSVHKC